VKNSITLAAMDTHKKDHSVAVIYPDTGELEEFTVRNNVQDVTRMARRVAKKAGGKVKFCYEAGVCGFTLQHWIQAAGSLCSVIAPSLIPVRPGDRIKTDRRDARKLLKLFMADELTEVHAPDPKQEAARELTRCRQAAQESLIRARHQLLKLLNRHGYLYTQGAHWTTRHRTWLTGLKFDQAYVQAAYDNYLTEVEHCTERVESLDRQVEALAASEPYREAVGILRCFRGIDTLTAICVLTEVFEFGRFDSPEALMAYLGMVPARSSSGPDSKDQRLPITKTGNGRVRRLLVEAATHYRHGSGVSVHMKKRRVGQPVWAVDLADRATKRLRRRYAHLIQRGKHRCKVTVAVARELAGFIWAMLRELRRRKEPAVVKG
jgi:transposase